MSIYDPVRLSHEVQLMPTMINGDSVALDITGEGVYIEDGVINIPVRLWENIQSEKGASNG